MLRRPLIRNHGQYTLLLYIENNHYLFSDWLKAYREISCRFYNNHVKDLGNHAMYDHGSWFLRVIMLRLHPLCCLPSAEAKAWLFCHSVHIETIQIQFLWYPKWSVSHSMRVISPSLQLGMLTPTSTLIILHITKTSSNNCLSLHYFSC